MSGVFFMSDTTTQVQTGAVASAAQAGEPAIRVDSVHKWYGNFRVLEDVNLDVSPGERIVICGPSGSGKSTFIRCINRLEEHQRGHIIVNGTELTDDIKDVDRIRREVGM